MDVVDAVEIVVAVSCCNQCLGEAGYTDCVFT